MPDAYARIAKLFPMLSASSDGERLNAVRAILKVLGDNKMHITDLSKRIASGAPEEDPPFDGGRKSDAYRKAGGDPRDPFAKARQERQGRHWEDHGPRRKPSKWAQDKADVERSFMRRGELDEWTVEFMESIQDQVVHQGRSLTDRQRDKLNEILDKLGL